MKGQQRTASTASTPTPGTDAPAPTTGSAGRGNQFAAEQLAARTQQDPARGGVRAGLPTTKAQALRRHERGRRKIARVIDAGLAQQVDPAAGIGSRQNLYRNSAQWIDQGEAQLVVMAPTHDSHLRPSVPADQIALFDDRVDFRSAGATYDDSLDATGHATNDAGIQVDYVDTLGTMADDGTTLTIVDPAALSEGELVETLIHEVQHDADQHPRGAPWTAPTPAPDPTATDSAPAWVYNGYQTEFRAYWMENPEGSSADNFGSSTDAAVTNFKVRADVPGPDGALGTADDVSKTVATDFKNKRQESIFRFMVEPLRAAGDWWDPAATDWTQTYAYVGHYYALDPAFKAMVDGLAIPRAGNLVNSVRIQALSEAIEAGDPAAVKAATSALDALDRGYLADQARSQAFWDQARDKLDLVAYMDLYIEIGLTRPTDPVQGDTYTVVAGDSLSRIADRMLGDTHRWREIYKLNRDVIGDDPDHITPGQQLRLPAL